MAVVCEMRVDSLSVYHRRPSCATAGPRGRFAHYIWRVKPAVLTVGAGVGEAQPAAYRDSTDKGRILHRIRPGAYAAANRCPSGTRRSGEAADLDHHHLAGV